MENILELDGKLVAGFIDRSDYYTTATYICQRPGDASDLAQAADELFGDLVEFGDVFHNVVTIKVRRPA